MALDLTVNQAGANGQNAVGAESQWKQLQALAAETAGKSITIVASVAELPPTGSDRHVSDGATRGGKKGAGKPESPGPDENDEYIVQDGKIKFLGRSQSQGPAADITRLLATAAKDAPSDHLALIVQSHGDGSSGITQGDLRHASPTDIQKAIEAGLKGSGHSSLDVLDFDSCYMGEASTLRAASGVADHVVASSEEEFAGDDHKFDGQNLTSVLGDLVKTPTMTPSQFSDDFVRHANLGDNGTPEIISDDFIHPHTGTDTLASFDMSKYPQFEDRLNNFGQALDQALKSSPQDKAVIIAAIDQAQSLPVSDPSGVAGTRDLMQFTQAIEDAVKSGQLSDPDGKLAVAAKQLLEAQGKLTSSSHVSDTPDYSTTGGLSVALPSMSSSDFHQRAFDVTSVGQLIDLSVQGRFSFRAEQTSQLQRAASGLRDELNKDHVNDAGGTALASALVSAEKATSAQAYDAAIQAVHDDAEQISQDPAFAAEVSSNEQFVSRHLEAQPSSDGGPQWNGFVADLYASNQ